MKILKKVNASIVTAMTLCIFQATVSAQTFKFLEGSERPFLRSEAESGNQCFAYSSYIVKIAVKESSEPDSSPDGRGDEIDIFRRDPAVLPPEICRTFEKSLIKIKNAQGNEFAGVFGDLIFVKRSVFPDGGNLDVYDLRTKKIAFSTEYSEWDNYRINLAGGRFLSYRQWSKKDGLLKNCREAKKWKREGFGISWLQTKRLDLQTMKAASVGSLRCINVQ